MKKVEILIPTQYNDGREVTKKTITDIEWKMVERFGGFTYKGMVEGSWKDDTDGAVYNDRNRLYTIATDDIAGAEELVRHIGKTLKQKAMYMEVQNTTVEIIKIE